jgi:hypothetical protein
MKLISFIALLGCLAAMSSAASLPSHGFPAASTMRLRGGGILHRIADSLGVDPFPHLFLAFAAYVYPVSKTMTWRLDAVMPGSLVPEERRHSRFCSFAPFRLATAQHDNHAPIDAGWKREKIGTKELGCGPLPQTKPQGRHTEEGKRKNKQHNGEGMTRSHSFTIPDVANQR